jgi:L-amino acid N-acyltransferase YncA
MGFNPDAYGNPRAKKNGVSPPRSDIVFAPGWDFSNDFAPATSRTPDHAKTAASTQRGPGSSQTPDVQTNTYGVIGPSTPIGQSRRVAHRIPTSTLEHRTKQTSVPHSPPKTSTIVGVPSPLKELIGPPSIQDNEPDQTSVKMKPATTPLRVNTLKQNYNLQNGDGPPVQVTALRKATNAMTSSPERSSRESSAALGYKNFDATKKTDETPQQMIARLQAEGASRAHLKTRRNQEGGDPANTIDLKALDELRASPLHPIIRPQSMSQHATQPIQHRRYSLRRGAAAADLGDAGTKLEERAIHAKDQQLENTEFVGDDDYSIDSTMDQDYTISETYSSAQKPQNHLQTRPTNLETAKPTASVAHKPSQNASTTPASTITGFSTQFSMPVTKQSKSTQKPRESLWCKNSDLKPPSVKPDSTSEGSEPLSDVDSTMPMHNDFGRLLRKRVPEVAEENLAGWDGKFAPAPAEWELRPQFYNNTPEYISGFDGWLGDVTVRTMSDRTAPDFDFGTIPIEELENSNNCPDGIGFTARDTVLHPHNAERYGYSLKKPLRADPENPLDFVGDAKVDIRDDVSARHRNKNAEMFVKQRMALLERTKREAEGRKLLAQTSERELAEALAAEESQLGADEQLTHQPVEPITTKNIYLRPAVDSDIPNLTKLFNWHVQNNVRPVELKPLPEDDMRNRLEISQHNRLPFIVAVQRTRHNSRHRPSRPQRVNPNHPIQNIDPDYTGVRRDEPILGFASATDWSATDYIDNISAELEVYVAPEHRQSGVGRCLMDAILEATDRGYIKKGGYEFRVAPEIKHMYTSGGGRDLHKLIFQARSFNKPWTLEQRERIRRVATGKPENGKGELENYNAAAYRHSSNPWYSSSINPGNPRNPNNIYSTHPSPPIPNTEGKGVARPDPNCPKEKINDREDDYEMWLKAWLERNGFEEEATMRKLGAKDGRFVDVHYLTKETCWQPAEGRVPDFSNGL